uniref:Putative secreted protein n=1 Tax=Amblyomma americanum TaxID=6943 RepID=A0A0C9S3M3_AMBAM
MKIAFCFLVSILHVFNAIPECASSSKSSYQPPCHGECIYHDPFDACGADCICYKLVGFDDGFCGSYEGLYSGEMDESDIHGIFTRDQLNYQLKKRGKQPVNASRSSA